jgi:tripartite-type tricarboxylate transporter receptor subunit TctC
MVITQSRDRSTKKPRMSSNPRSIKLLARVLLALILSCGAAAPAVSQSSFYEGKTIKIIHGSEPGGAEDARSRVLIPFLQKHIPGSPTLLNEYMPGAGGGKLANYIFQSARPDGLTVGLAGSGFVSNAVLGQSGVLYDVDKFIYLGSADTGAQYVFLTRKSAGLNNLEKLRAFSGLRIGSQSVGHSSYIAGRIFTYLIGLKEPKFISGYTGPEIDLALKSGEIDARNNPVHTIMMRNPDWIEKGLMDFHASIEIPKGNKHPRFAHVPEAESFTKNERERRLLIMQRSFRLTGSPYIFPPNTSANAVIVLRDAMRKTLTDPEFHKAFKKQTGDDATPLLAEEIEKVIKELPRDAEVAELFKIIAGGDRLPAR